MFQKSRPTIDLLQPTARKAPGERSLSLFFPFQQALLHPVPYRCRAAVKVWCVAHLIVWVRLHGALEMWAQQGEDVGRSEGERVRDGGRARGGGEGPNRDQAGVALGQAPQGARGAPHVGESPGWGKGGGAVGGPGDDALPVVGVWGRGRPGPLPQGLRAVWAPGGVSGWRHVTVNGGQRLCYCLLLHRSFLLLPPRPACSIFFFFLNRCDGDERPVRTMEVIQLLLALVLQRLHLQQPSSFQKQPQVLHGNLQGLRVDEVQDLLEGARWEVVQREVERAVGLPHSKLLRQPHAGTGQHQPVGSEGLAVHRDDGIAERARATQRVRLLQEVEVLRVVDSDHRRRLMKFSRNIWKRKLNDFDGKKSRDHSRQFQNILQWDVMPLLGWKLLEK